MHDGFFYNAEPSATPASECYRDLPLIQLVSRISRDADSLALKEFHGHRPVFRLRNGPALLFIRFVDALRETTWAAEMAGHDDQVLERACDIVIDRFSHLPGEQDRRVRGRASGVDCRHYFRGFLCAWANVTREQGPLNPIQAELAAARILQRGVVRHFRLSCLEARRKCNPARSRYSWRLDTGTIAVWMPVVLSGQERRAWLETHVEDPDPSRPLERQRVQWMVDEAFGIAHHVPLSSDLPAIASRCPAHDPTGSGASGEGTVELAVVVADEKAARIGTLRPAVRTLGPARLRALVLAILGAVIDGRYDETRLAREFGLSKATMSRFAGSRWQDGKRVPDLWLNVAQTVAHHALFMEAAHEAQVWRWIQEVVEHPRPTISRREDR